MDEELRYRITTFFDYWRKRYLFINNLDFNNYSHEANVLIWASLDALSNLWAKNIGKEQCGKAGNRVVFDAFLARYGGDFFQLVSLPDVWHRIDEEDIELDKKGKVKLSQDVCLFLENIGGRLTQSNIKPLEERQIRSVSDDWRMDKIITEIQVKFPQTNCTDIKKWLALSRYGSIAYKQMRCAYIHEGRAGKNTHSFELHGSGIQPTYCSWIYSTPPIIGFKVEFMLRVLECCIHAFESEALKLEKDPVPEK